MVTLKTSDEIQQMKKAGQIVAACHKEIRGMVKPGVTTLQLNDYIEKRISEMGGSQFTKGFMGYPFATCISVNDVIAHGFPGKTPLKNGDIVKIDIVAIADGWVGDSAWCYEVGTVSEEAKRLMQVAKECLYIGIQHAVVGNRIGDVMHPLQQHAEQNGYSLVRDLLGHGVGRSVHEEPNFTHIGKPGKGFRLKEGMVITLEPMLNQGTYHMTIDDDNWTARTADGKLSAQYEHTIAITADGPVVLTEQD